jgi:hypothetical protein
MRLAVLVVVFALGLGAMAVGSKRNRLVLALSMSVLVLAGLWLATAIAVYTDWRDADGFVDCWPNCSAYQDASGAILLGAPAVLAAWLAVAALFSWRRRRRAATL